MLEKIPFDVSKEKVRDAFRLALQSSISAVITYSLMQSFGLPEIFVGVLSAVLVVEPSIGNTFNQAQGRIVATIVGSAIGFILATFFAHNFTPKHISLIKYVIL